ncbi:hypothetical protein [Chitinophaga rhizosphaerae]|uniref:hypothetical protein n=1 Tax=Chitinophaga rhizosphaerae TaxID=1864947 RepID=UPI000F804517|nr:hypothetical protein [Chitinophaga rhizosphaerae]
MKSTITPLSVITAFVVVAMTQAWSASGGLSTAAGSTPYVHWTDTVPMEPGDTTPKKEKKKKKDRKEREDTSNKPRPDTFRTFRP